MKSIIFFRHGQAKSSSIDLDHNRQLAHSGIIDAKKMGRHLSDMNEFPDLVITSTAVRAKTTAEIAMASGNWNCPLYFEPDIYNGDLVFLLGLIKKQDNKVSSICLVGHEPNFSTFIYSATGIKCMNLPTASMTKIVFNVIKWDDIIMGFANLDWHFSPKHLFNM